MKSTLSPGFRCSDLRTSAGSVICPLDVTFAD
jgi:hypothetical protein